MIQLCTDPTCDVDAGVTLQRQIDPAPVPYCLQHAAAREDVFRLQLENYQRVVVVALEPSELERTQARLEELEAKREARDLEEQLETALRTLEQQGKALESCRNELAESREAFAVAQRELERTRKRAADDLALAHAELERTRRELDPQAPQTPVPPTRPDQPKP